MRLRSDSPEATEAIAALIAPELVAGDVVTLDGDLGGGKTAFVRAVAQAMGTNDDVTSPTFTIVQHYAARVPIVHVDAYRLRGPDDTDDLALDELLERSVVFVEWAAVIDAALPVERLALHFAPGAHDCARIITIEFVGARCSERADQLMAQLAPFAASAA